MTLWKVTKLISTEGKGNPIIKTEALPLGAQEIRHQENGGKGVNGETVVPITIRRGDVIEINVEPDDNFKQLEWLLPPYPSSLRSVVLEPEDGEVIFGLWAPCADVKGVPGVKDGNYNEVVSVECHSKDPMRTKER